MKHRVKATQPALRNGLNMGNSRGHATDLSNGLRSRDQVFVHYTPARQCQLPCRWLRSPESAAAGTQLQSNDPLNSQSVARNTLDQPQWRLIVLTIIAVAFLVLRLPVIFRQPGGQDEDCYAVPGITVLRTGYPQLPHVPARNLESVYYRADEMLYCEPPLYFYYQAAFYAVLPDIYGTARLASVVAGLLMVGAIYWISQLTGVRQTGALAAAGMLSLSRWFYFPATCARPDILCALFGVAAILAFLYWRKNEELRWLVVAGVFLGLGGLTHPFAIVYAIQLAVWALTTSPGWKRIGHPALLALIALAVFSLWIPLILKYPETFRNQFRNQFGVDSGGSVLRRLLLPGPSLLYHAQTMWAHIGGLQFSLVAGGLLVSTVMSWRGRRSGLWTICCLVWSSIYLMSVSVGTHHIVSGYWVYPAALAFIPLGYGFGQAWDSGSSSRRRVLVAAAILLFVPGSGIRAWMVYLKNWNDIHYDEPRFAKQLIESLPPEDVVIVDTQLALDFVVAERKVLLAQVLPQYFRVDQYAYDRLIVSRFGEDNQIAQLLEGRLERTEGIPNDIFACLARVYRSPADRQVSPSQETLPASGEEPPK